MELTLKRVRFGDYITTGQLYVNGVYFCFTLEDKVREPAKGYKSVDEWKVKGETAIPYGLYKVVLEDSPKFGSETMTLVDVPGFNKIRIHSGNTQNDTEGCIIVGYKITDTGVIIPGTTRPAVADLKRLVKMGPSTSIKIFS